jgi:hypothetical protein
MIKEQGRRLSVYTRKVKGLEMKNNEIRKLLQKKEKL